MAKLEHNMKDNPRLEQRKLADGRISLYLDYYFGRRSEPVLDEYGKPVRYKKGRMKGKPRYKVTHIRRQENLCLYLFEKPHGQLERDHNKETLRVAKQQRFEAEQKFLEDRMGYRLKRDEKISFLEFCDEYVAKYKKGDVRMVKLAINRFKDFLDETPEYKNYKDVIQASQLDKRMMEDFTDYLQSRGRGEGPKTIYQRFKKVINYAIDEGILTKNPCRGVTIRADDKILRKDVLSQDEIRKLLQTHYDSENADVRRAFTLCLFSGIRFCDVKCLTFANVDYGNKLLKFEQNKTKGHSGSSGVVIPLNEYLINLIGRPQAGQGRDSLIFRLPSYQACLYDVKRWVASAEIEKHISWHCARHSFAVNILNNGANIKTVSSLLGHASLQHTEKYTRAVDKLKLEAINSLMMPGLE